MRQSLHKKKTGFTLTELMIIVAIIGILAAVAIPRYAQMLERAREGATKGNLSCIRTAVEIYYAKNEGQWPGLVGMAVFSEYLNPIPPAKARPLGNSSNITFDSTPPSASGTGWRYDSTSGTVWCNSNENDGKGTSFSTY